MNCDNEANKPYELYAIQVKVINRKLSIIDHLKLLVVRGNSTKKNHNTSVCDRSMEIGTHDQDDLRKCFFKRDT